MTMIQEHVLRQGQAAKLKELGRMKEYLIFSEQYLNRLISSKVVIKDRQNKVVKIANYN